MQAEDKTLPSEIINCCILLRMKWYLAYMLMMGNAYKTLVKALN